MDKMEIDETFDSIDSWVESEEDRQYNKFVAVSLTGIEPSTIRKIVKIENPNVYVVYTNETFEESFFKWQMRNKQ